MNIGINYLRAAGYEIRGTGCSLGAAGPTDCSVHFDRDGEKFSLRGRDEEATRAKVHAFLTSRSEMPTEDAATIAGLRHEIAGVRSYVTQLEGERDTHKARAAEVMAAACRDDAAIKVWRFGSAPDALAALSDHGGDEDWLALIPPTYAGDYIGWAEDGSSFGCCSVSEHALPDGSVVRIGAHA